MLHCDQYYHFEIFLQYISLRLDVVEEGNFLIWNKYEIKFWLLEVKPRLTGVNIAKSLEAGNTDEDGCDTKPAESHNKDDIPRIINQYWLDKKCWEISVES